MHYGILSTVFEFIGFNVVTMFAVCMLIRLSNMDNIKPRKAHRSRVINRKRNVFVYVNKVA